MAATVATAHADDLGCEEDEALSAAAADLLLEGGALSPARLERAAVEARSDAVRLFAISLAQNEGDDRSSRVTQWLDALRVRADAPLSCGEASSANRRLVIATFRGGTLFLSGGDPAGVRGTLASGFSEPHLVVESSDRASETIAIDATDLARGIELPDVLVGPIEVQLVARGPRGIRPVAKVASDGFVSSADGPSSSPSAPPAHGRSSRSVDSVADRIAELRVSHGAAPLRAHRILTREAQRHASRVCEAHVAAHEIGAAGDPEQRLHHAGLRARHVGETIARANDVDAAWRALVGSPSHYAALSDRRFTDAGIGRASDDRGNVCIVVLLAAWPRLFR